tara:strand:+ start:723 stop:1763 length:1041 start_codon:yes stop_codon:yes gene_type:complete
MAYTTIDNPELFFQTLLHVGNNTSFTFAGSENMQPDLIWNKNRDSSGYDHHAIDSVRGVSKLLRVSSNIAEFTSSDSITAIGSDGFTVGADSNGYVSSGTDKQVSWCWKGGTTSIPSGSTSDPSGVSYNATSGFGIYKITAPGSGNYVLKHGLGTTPNFIWVKDLDATQKHMIWVDQFSNLTDDYLQLNSNAAKATYSTCWGTMNTTDATIATGGTLDVNNDHVIYVFSNRQGFSKIGSYTGNGNADGPFIYTGFKPAMVILKETTSSGQWYIFDNKRDTFNLMTDALFPDLNNAETTDNAIDFLSNGFKGRKTSSDLNTSGNNHIYMAFAESPFVNSNGVPTNGR